jgi:hypothetical protein
VFVALGIQYAMRMRHIASVACPAAPNFAHYLTNGKIFETKKKIESKIFSPHYNFNLENFILQEFRQIP